MKYAKCLGLSAVAAAVLMAFAGTASATTITSSGSTYTGFITLTSEYHVVLDNPIAKIECNSSVTSKVESHGAGVTAKANVLALSFTSCTNDWHVTVVAGGSLEAHALESGDATLTSSGATIEATRFGVSCRYATNFTDIGRLTDGDTGSGGGFYTPGTVHVQAEIPFHSGSFLCGTGATTWTGSYGITNLPLSVDP